MPQHSAAARMVTGRSLGRQFGFLWAAFSISTFGTWLAFDAFALIAIRVLHSGPIQVSALAASGLAIGALMAVPLGPWVEFHRKRPVMIAMDLTRFAAMLSVPVAFALGQLTYTQLLIVSIIASTANIAYRAASGAFLKAIVRPPDLVTANARLESTTWTATALGPPLGGAAIGLFGPVTTVIADAISYLLSALTLRAIGSNEPQPGQTNSPAAGSPTTGSARAAASRTPTATFHRYAGLLQGWHHILSHPTLRPLFFNTILVNGLIMATSPLLAVLMLGQLGFQPWQYGLAFGAPCVGGFISAQLAPRLVARFGHHNVMIASGTLRACWSIGLAFIRPGTPGLLLAFAIQFGLVASVGVFNPLLVTFRLEQTPSNLVARTLSAWQISSNLTIAFLTASWGVLATMIGPRFAIGIAGACLLATIPLLRRGANSDSRRECAEGL